MKKSAVIACLALILSGALAARLCRIDSAPPGFYLDEASFGYNAYSILKTGRDEFGTRLPLFTPSFGTGKNPAQLYATVASVAAFGLNERAVRLPSAIFGVFSILFAFLFATELFRDSRIGLAAAFLLAISPWHFHFFSRAGFEPMSMVCFITLGSWLMLLGLRKKWALPAAGAAFAISLYCYAPALLFVPLLALFFFILYFPLLKDRLASCAAAALIFIVLATPHLLPGVKGGEQNAHFLRDTVFNSSNDARSLALLRASRAPGTDFIKRHPLLIRCATFARNYLSSISYNYLFASGDTSTNRASVKGFGVMFRAEFYLLIAGLALAARFRSRPLLLLVAWLAAAPVAAAMTNQWVPNSCRLITYLPGYQILFAFAAVWLLHGYSPGAPGGNSKTFRAPKMFKIAGIGICIYLAVNAFSFYSYYFKHYPADSAPAWQYGFREAIKYSEEKSARYPNVVVSMNLSYSYIMVLFYTGFDPETLITEKPLRFAGPPEPDSGLFAPRIGSLGRYHIGPPHRFLSNSPILYILAPGEMPELKTIKEFTIGGSRPYLRIAESIPAPSSMQAATDISDKLRPDSVYPRLYALKY